MNSDDILKFLRDLITSPLLSLSLLVLIALSRESLKKFLDALGGVFTPLLVGVSNISYQAKKDIDLNKNDVVETTDKAVKALQAVLTQFAFEVNSAIKGLCVAIKHIACQVSDNDLTLLGWRLLGVGIELIALIALVVADASISANNLIATGIISDDQVIPELRNLTLPLVMASTGSSLILGMIVGDFLSLSHFGLWSKLKRRSAKFIILFTCILTFGIVVLLSVSQGLERLEVLRAPLESELFNLIKIISFTAQSVLIFPLLITTFFIFRGFAGIFIIVLLIMGIIWFVLHLFRGIAELLATALDLGGISGKTAVKILGLFLGFSFFIISYLFFGLGTGFASLISVFHQLVDVASSPVTKIWGAVNSWIGAELLQKAKDALLNDVDKYKKESNLE